MEQEGEIVKYFKDHMNCLSNYVIKESLDIDKGEYVVFSCLVVKINRWFMKQDRTLLLTNNFLYNIKKDEVQRRISLSDMKAMSRSTK